MVRISHERGVQMPRYHCVVESPIHTSFRVQQVTGMFDVPPSQRTRQQFEVELPGLDEPWQIGVIVGPSGSGKSTIARHAFGEHLYAGSDWPNDRAVVDCFEGDSIKPITSMLTSVGFSSPPSWLKPYHVLSNGEKFRCDLARALLSGRSPVVFDEFTSVVDRTVAQVGSAALAKAVRRNDGQRFVAVTCHYDVLDWLEPDWVLDMASGELVRGRLRRRPAMPLEIHASKLCHWPQFAKYHYLNTKSLRVGRCYVATHPEAGPIAFAVVMACIGHTGLRRISRVVVLPDFQGIGVGTAFIEAVARLTLAREGVSDMRIRTGHPAMIAALRRDPNWKCVGFETKWHKASGLYTKLSNSFGRATASFQFVSDPRLNQVVNVPNAEKTATVNRTRKRPQILQDVAPRPKRKRVSSRRTGK